MSAPRERNAAAHSLMHVTETSYRALMRLIGKLSC